MNNSESKAEKPIPQGEVKMLAILEDFSHHLASSVDREDLARQWSSDVGQLDYPRARQEVARRLCMPLYARNLCPHGEVPQIPYADYALQEGLADRAEAEQQQQDMAALQGIPGYERM